MILLDTAVVLEPLRKQCNLEVVRWLDDLVIETCCITAFTLAEIYRAVDRLPAMERAALRRERMDERFLELFDGRILSFDMAAAKSYRTVVQRVRSQGFSISRRNAELAALALDWRMAVGTWNATPFLAAGCNVREPWGWWAAG